MHAEVLEWVGRWATDEVVDVLDIGGRDLNGTCRHLFPNADYTTIDLVAGPGVDIVADAATWDPTMAFDVVLCAEVFEHTPDWPAICATAYQACRDGGRFIVTCAAPKRAAHSGRTAGPLEPGEFYCNVAPEKLKDRLADIGWRDIEIDLRGADLRATAVR